jgi:hypothetical protein
MSTFGHDLIPTGDDKSKPEDDKDDGGFLDFLGDAASDIRDKVADELNDIGSNIADKLAGELGISQWYSLHMMDSCEGNYQPNATAPNPGYNVTNCTEPRAGCKFQWTANYCRAICADTISRSPQFDGASQPRTGRGPL